MKIRPVILCGGAGTRLWTNQKNHQAKQFIDFGGWSLIQKTLERIKKPFFDYPVISTNIKYLKEVRKSLKKNKVKKYKIVLEPASIILIDSATVAFVSIVSVVVMDWIRIGFSPPIPSVPTLTSRVLNREY